ncbi:MAG: 3-dehydroquinate synthase, partial [Candidatus Portiera sp.]|nr:3-dehydroquinate synthase [Portiera sp.]
MNEPIIVQHSRGSYPIYFASRLSEHLESLRESLKATDDFVILINKQVNNLYPKQLEQLAKQLNCQHPPLIIADGEEHKNINTIGEVCTDISKLGLSRQSCLIAIGGGVTTDLVGYAAASYMRGINCIQVPTTLLAQVDASIGGKTGVNLPSGKNLVGAFHQPKAVLISSEFLAQLPSEELACGFAEIIKHALLADNKFFRLLEDFFSTTEANT